MFMFLLACISPVPLGDKMIAPLVSVLLNVLPDKDRLPTPIEVNPLGVGLKLKVGFPLTPLPLETAKFEPTAIDHLQTARERCCVRVTSPVTPKLDNP